MGSDPSSPLARSVVDQLRQRRRYYLRLFALGAVLALASVLGGALLEVLTHIPASNPVSSGRVVVIDGILRIAWVVGLFTGGGGAVMSLVTHLDVRAATRILDNLEDPHV
jgi:hypothetical protein